VKIRFQADADLRGPIVTGLKRREPLIDFKSAQEADLEGIDDLTVLRLAAEEGRLLVSHDVSTMPENFAAFIQQNDSAGVVLIRQDWSYQEAIDGLLKLWLTTDAVRWQNVLFYLPR
jgi:hypothetical protein